MSVSDRVTEWLYRPSSWEALTSKNKSEWDEEQKELEIQYSDINIKHDEEEKYDEMHYKEEGHNVNI